MNSYARRRPRWNLYYFLAYALFIAAGKLLEERFSLSSLSYVKYAIYPTLFVAGLVVFREAFAYSWGMLRKHIIRSILLLAGLYLTYVLLSYLSYMLFDPTVSEGGINDLKVYQVMKTLPAYITLPVLGVMGPIVEEFIYRYLLINQLSKRMAVWKCVIVSSLLFGLLHIHSFADLVNVVPYIVMGLVLGTLYVKSRYNLLLPILFHVFNNLSGLIPQLLN